MPAQPGELGADGDGGGVAGVALGGELLRGAAASAHRRLGHEQQQLRVPQREIDRPGRQGQPGPVATQDGEPRRRALGRGGGRTAALEPGAVQPAQLGLHRRRGRADEGEHLRAGDVVAAGDVDRAEQRAGHRVVHGRRGAAPRLHRPAVVLAAVDLHEVVERERRPRRVGAGDLLGPAGTLDEVHARRPGPQPGVALHPQHAAGGIGDRDDHPVDLGVLDEQPADHRHHRRQWMGLAVGDQVVVEQLDRRSGPVGIHPAAQAAPPRVPDDGTHRPGRLGGPGDQPLVRRPQPAGEGRTGPPMGQGEPRVQRRRHGLLRDRGLISAHRPRCAAVAPGRRRDQSVGGSAGSSARTSRARSAPTQRPAP